MIEQGLPAAPDCERSILGGIILDNGLIGIGLSPEQFYLDSHRRIFRRMLDLAGKSEPIDFVSLSQELAAAMELEAAGGVSYLTSLTEGVPQRRSLENYARIIREKANLRKIIQVANETLDRAFQQNASAVELAQGLEASVAGIHGSHLGRKLLIPAARFCSTMPPDIEWLIEGIVPAGSNGIISGEPKASKSWISDEACLSLASGQEFLGFNVPRALRVALFAREDYPGLTSWRLSALFRSRTWKNPNFFAENLYVNTRAQSDQLLIDNPQHLDEIIQTLRREKIQFAMFDVLNILHESDENDNTEMRKVMNKFSYIQAKTGCPIGIVHHLGKVDGKWVRRLRGASSIHGWVEWLFGVTEVDADSRIRKMEFELKAGEIPDPIYYRIESDKNLARIVRCDPPVTHAKGI